MLRNLAECVWKKHFTKRLHTQKKLKLKENVKIKGNVQMIL